MKKKFFILSVLLSGFVSLFAKGNTTTDEYLGTPFGGTAWPVPGIVGAADFDIGGEGVAYHDTDATNSAGTGNLGYFYRDNEETGQNDAPGVDLQWRDDAGCYNIGWTYSGEWLNYTIDVKEEGLYDIACSAETSAATFDYTLDLDFVPINTYSFPANGSNNIADNFTAKAVLLPAGKHVITFTFAGPTSGFRGNLIKMNFTKAYTGTALKENAIPGAIQAEDFDEGGNGVAYYNPGTATNTYRPAENIEIGGSGDNVYVATAAGEWLKYTINVPALTYKDFVFTFYWATTKAEKFTVLVNGYEVAKEVEIPNTGGVFQAVELPELVRIFQGENVVTILADGGNLNKFEITKPPYLGTPFLGEPFEVPGSIIEAEYFDAGGEGIAYHDTDASNSGPSKEVRPESPGVDMQPNTFDGEPIINIGWTDASEWLNYTINVAEDASYDITIVAATANVDQTVYFALDGRRIASTVVHTGSHATFQKFPAKQIPLTAGIHVLTLSSTGSTNYDKIIIEKSYFGTPFNGPHVIPGAIEAEDFDDAPDIVQNGNGETYYNPGTIATPNTYRPEVNIEIGGTEEERYLAAAANEWVKYTFDVPAGTKNYYIFSFLWASPTRGTFDVLLDDKVLEEGVEVPNTGSYDNYEEAELMSAIQVAGGTHTLTLKVKTGHLDKINILESYYMGLPFFGEAYKVPAQGNLVIEAQYFDWGGREVAFHDNTTNGGTGGGKDDGIDISKIVRGEEDGSSNVEMEYRNGTDADGKPNVTIGWSNVGEWVAYSIDVEEAGIYDIFLLLSTNNDDRANHIKIDYKSYPEITARTSAWTDFQEFVNSDIELTKGIHVLYVYYNGNFDKIRITKHVDTTPYGGTPQAIPGILEAWKFDEGGQSLTYLVANKTLGGENNAIRKNVEVPIGGNETEGYFIDITEANTPSWALYTVDVKEEGYYKATFKVGCNAGGEKITLSSGATSATIVLPDAFGEWKDIEFPIIKIDQGLKTLKLAFNNFGIKIASVTFEKLDVIDRSNWVITVSDEQVDDGGGKYSMLDDNYGTFWHSQWSPSIVQLPHWAIFDMKAPVEISKIITIRRSNGDTQSVQYSVSNDPDLAEWPVIAEGAYASQSDGIHDLSLDATQTIKARYLKLTLPDSFREQYTNIAQVYVIGKSFDGISKPVGTLPGKVYAENGVLKVKEFPANASLAVYNLLGQKVAAYKTLNGDLDIYLPAKGIYIVKVQNSGLTSSYKVIVK